MFNEILFFSHLLLLSSLLLVVLRIGKQAMYVFISILPLMANLFVIKQVNLFGFQVTPSDCYFVCAVLGMNLMREYYGNKDARRCIYYSFMVLILFVINAKLHLFYIPSSFDYTQSSYQIILENSPRIVIAGLCVFFLSERLDLFLYSHLKKKFPQRTAGFRFFASTMCSQLFDTVVFSYAGLYGILDSMWDLILFSYIIKVILIFFSTPFAYFSRKVIFTRKSLAVD